MNRHTFTYAILFVYFISLLGMPNAIYAKQPDLKAGLANGWNVEVFGNPMNNVWYTQYLYSVAQANAMKSPNQIFSFFNWQEMQIAIEKVNMEYPQPGGRLALEQLIIRAFSQHGVPVRQGNMEISAGVEFSQQLQVNSNLPESYRCGHRTVNGELEWGICGGTNNYLPYLRIRYSLGTPLPTVEAKSYSGASGLYFRNDSNKTILVAIAYYWHESESWVSQGWTEIKPGETRQVYPAYITDRYIAYLAKTDTQTWEGDRPFWVSSKSWEPTKQWLSEKDAKSKGYYKQAFRLIDIASLGNSAGSYMVILPPR